MERLALYAMSENSLAGLCLVVDAEMDSAPSEIDCEIFWRDEKHCNQAFTGVPFVRTVIRTNLGLFINHTGKAFPKGQTIFVPVFDLSALAL